MVNEDTINLLKECNLGTKMAVKSFDEVLERVKSLELKQVLEESKKKHEEIGDKTHQRLLEYNNKDEEPNPIVDAMSWMKINLKYAMDSTDNEIAGLIMDGCNMGIKSVSKYLNQYKNAEKEVKNMVDDLVKLEQKLMDELRVFLN